MVLVNLAENAWSTQRPRNPALFAALLGRGTLFESGLYVDPPKVLAPRASIAERLACVRESRVLSPILANAHLFRPCYAPPFSMRPLIRPLLAYQQATTVFKYLDKRPFCLWMNNIDLPAYGLFEVLARKAHAIVLDMSDDWSAFHDKRPEQRDARIFGAMRQAHMMLAVNETVKKKFPHGNCIVVGNATDFDNFQRRNPAYSFEDILPRKSGQKIVGFVGGLNKGRVDEPLLDLLINRFRNVLFLFVGYSNNPELVRKLQAFENVRFIKSVPYDDLPFVISAFDVAIVPHLDNEHTRGNDLLKVLDYLATGVPVVSTDCSNVRQQYGDAVTVADSHDEFVAAVGRLLDSSPPDPHAGREMVRARDWRVVATRLETVLKPLLS